jgi:retinol dehydrogenase-12
MALTDQLILLFKTPLMPKCFSQNIYVNSNHPGAVNTELQRHVDGILMRTMGSLFFIAPEDGARTQLYLATSPEIEKNSIKGKYFVPYGDEAQPNKHATSQENQTKLWDFTENLLKEKVPGYTGANI